MISTRSNHEFINPAIYDAMAANHRASRRLLLLAQYCNACAVSAATTPILMHDQVAKIFIDLQDELLEANADVSHTHGFIAELAI